MVLWEYFNHYHLIHFGTVQEGEIRKIENYITASLGTVPKVAWGTWGLAKLLMIDSWMYSFICDNCPVLGIAGCVWGWPWTGLGVWGVQEGV